MAVTLEASKYLYQEIPDFYARPFHQQSAEYALEYQVTDNCTLQDLLTGQRPNQEFTSYDLIRANISKLLQVSEIIANRSIPPQLEVAFTEKLQERAFDVEDRSNNGLELLCKELADEVCDDLQEYHLDQDLSACFAYAHQILTTHKIQINEAIQKAEHAGLLTRRITPTGEVFALSQRGSEFMQQRALGIPEISLEGAYATNDLAPKENMDRGALLKIVALEIPHLAACFLPEGYSSTSKLILALDGSRSSGEVARKLNGFGPLIGFLDELKDKLIACHAAHDDEGTFRLNEIAKGDIHSS